MSRVNLLKCKSKKPLVLGVTVLILLTLTTGFVSAGTSPSSFDIKDTDGKYTFRITFPDGEGLGYKEGYRIADVDRDFVKIGFNKSWEYQDRVNVTIEVLGADKTDWRFYSRDEMWDAGPQTRHLIKDWDDTNNKFRLQWVTKPTRTYGEFYFVQVTDNAPSGSAVLSFLLMPEKREEKVEEIIEDKTVSLTLEHIPPEFGKDIQNGGKIIATLLDENNKPMPYQYILIETDMDIADVFQNDYSSSYQETIRDVHKHLGITNNDRAISFQTDRSGKVTWNYINPKYNYNLYLDSPKLGKLLFEKAKAKKPVELEGTIRAWNYELYSDKYGKFSGGRILANATIPVKFTHIAEISSIGTTNSSQPPKVRAMRIDLDSWQSFFRAIGVSKSWSDIIQGSRQVLPGDCPYKLIPGDTILLDENDIITVKWINGYEMVIKTKAGFLEEVKKKTGEPANAHFTIMYTDLGKYRTVQEAVHNAEVQLTYALGSVAVGAYSNPAGYVAGVFGGFFWYTFGKGEAAYDPLIIEMKSTILFDFDEYEEKATVYTVEGTGTLYNINDGSTLDVTTGHKATVSLDGEFGPVTGFDESELNDDLRTILDYIGGEDVSVSLKKGLTFESRSKPSGSTIQIPLTLSGIEENIGNMDITLGYDSSVLEATDVIKGGLTTDSLFDYNIVDGTIKISLADKEGFNGDGSIAYVNFNVIGAEGSSSDLEIAAITANRADDYETVEIQTHDGLFSVISMEEGMGDGDGDGVYTALDALYALQMSVEKIPEDPVMDVNEDGSVTSFDARKILRIAAELETV